MTQAMAQQMMEYAPILTPTDHAEALHPGPEWARVALCWREGQRWRQYMTPVRDLPYVTRYLAGAPDFYLSVNQFRGYRRNVASLVAADALYVDLDYYRIPELRWHQPWQVAELARMALREEGIPEPSMVISSGGGLYLIWRHTPIPRNALPRWNACQRRLWEALRPFGADPAARDAARVLRLVGTRNSKHGVEVVALSDSGPIWPFDRLADEILPHSREELARLYDLRVRRALRQKPPALVAPEGFNAYTLWAARLSDLQKLRDLRWWGYIPPGERDVWMLLASTAISWISMPVVLRREVYALARQVTGPDGWSERETETRMSAVIRRALMAARGETVEWQGQQWDPRYRFRTDTIIELLKITPEEQRQLATIWSDEIRNEKDRERKEAERRAAGKQTREEYRAKAEERRKEAQRLREQGYSYRKIAEALGCSVGEAHRLLNG